MLLNILEVLGYSIRNQIEEEISLNRSHEELPPSITEKLNDPDYILVVSETVTSIPEGESATVCTLSEGDLLKAIQAPRKGESYARMKVVTSKKGSCPAGSEVLISLEDLQRFQNAFSESIETGLQRLEEEKDQLDED